MNINKTVLVSGSAGFIGAALVENLLIKKFNVIGIDDLNDYYDVSLKRERLKRLFDLNKNQKNNFIFLELDLLDEENLEKTFNKYHPDIVINLLHKLE